MERHPLTVRSTTSVAPPRVRTTVGGALALAAAVALAGCGGAGPGAGGGAGGAEAPESVWEELRRPRPEPLEGAARVTVSELELMGSGRWSDEGAVSPAVGLQELISAGLLRRRDVHFVERRRFTAAAERERRGQPRPEGAPPAGRSPGAELILTGSWLASSPDSATLELRLTRAESGEVVRAWRTSTPADADLPSLARSATGRLLRVLDELGRRPDWEDPLAGTEVDPAPASYRDAGVPREAVEAYLRGVSAVDRYEWEAARRAFQRALDVAGDDFFEADVALARAARLRAGEPLGSGP